MARASQPLWETSADSWRWWNENLHTYILLLLIGARLGRDQLFSPCKTHQAFLTGTLAHTHTHTPTHIHTPLKLCLPDYQWIKWLYSCSCCKLYKEGLNVLAVITNTHMHTYTHTHTHIQTTCINIILQPMGAWDIASTRHSVDQSILTLTSFETKYSLAAR